ncbi:MAG: histidine phosphatase family protein [Pseudomonadales bacterium]|nr:histidine phosphatase family protein [Pseudomonadales bacterium]
MNKSPQNFPPSTIFYLVRHARSQTNVLSDAGASQDSSLWHDSDLTSLGIEQATILSEKFQNIHLNAVFSSDAKKAQKTGEIIAVRHQLSVSTSQRIRETSAGNLHKIFFDRHNIVPDTFRRLSQQEKVNFRISEDMETFEEAALRFLTFIKELELIYKGLSILVVFHGALMKSLLMKIGFSTFDELTKGSIENTAYVVLEMNGNHFFLKTTTGIHKTEANQ